MTWAQTIALGILLGVLSSLLRHYLTRLLTRDPGRVAGPAPFYFPPGAVDAMLAEARNITSSAGGTGATD